MDKIKYSAFDFFRYLVPGSVFLFSAWLGFENSIKTVSDIVTHTQGIEWNFLLITALVSYIIGFALDVLKYLLLGKLIARHNSYDNFKEKELSNSEKQVLVREFSPSNFKYIETWYMLKGMCYNLAVAFIFLGVASIIKGTFNFNYNIWQWILLLVASITFTYLLILRAKVYAKWSAKDLDRTVSTLKLKEKVETWKNN